MPFVAEREGETVVPEEVPDDARLACLDCGDELRIRHTHERDGTFVARHFWHVGDADGCSGGESETHRRLKSIALSKVKHVFPCQEAGLERKIGDNIADVYAIFDRHLDRFGKGVVVEIQHRNKGKNVEAVTENYLEEGFGVYWADSTSQEGMDMELREPILVWPNAVPDPIYWGTGPSDSEYGGNFQTFYREWILTGEYLPEEDRMLIDSEERALASFPIHWFPVEHWVRMMDQEERNAIWDWHPDLEDYHSGGYQRQGDTVKKERISDENWKTFQCSSCEALFSVNCVLLQFIEGDPGPVLLKTECPFCERDSWARRTRSREIRKKIEWLAEQ